MRQLALEIPWGGTTTNIINTPGNKFSGANANLGTVLSGFINVAFYIAGFMMFVWMVWGVYEYILARGNKEELAKARNRIWWALLGFMILAMAVFIGQYAQNLFPAANNFNKLRQITPPTEKLAPGAQPLQGIPCEPGKPC